ncbi:MAG: hypothetical protein RQ936_00990 [Gammaproteobacteria bacterium]|nr:hypothetical protein [Gammaproteobacteria bacterium]
MSDEKHKNIPTLEDVVQPGKEKEEVPAKAKREASDRRSEDRRKKQVPLPEAQGERRVSERRSTTRRSVDQRRSEEMNELVEKIMQDMMPDLEQHLFLQLRFELQKYIPKILSEFKDRDENEE